MKFQFDANLDFQHSAIESVVRVFSGQDKLSAGFSVSAELELPGMMQTELGIGNKLNLLNEDILKNVRDIQLKNGLAPTKELGPLNFTVEMETGTGKTYVYLRTIFELHRAYGFSKFIVVVPSIAVKEGVYKSIQMTEEHFRGLYDNVPFDYFVYDSQKLGQVRNFATSDCIQIMVINIDAFRKSFSDPNKEDKANIIHRAQDRMSGNKPIEFIKQCNPILIIDEPQSVDTTEKSKEAIASLNPLCTLRYSATHLDKHHMLYRLDSIDAYQKGLVKQIEVLGIEVKDSHNRGYIKLLKVDNKKSPITAQVEMDVQMKSGEVKRQKKTVKSGSDLHEVSSGRDVYDGYMVEDIYCKEGEEYISFSGRPDIVELGAAINDIDDDSYKRIQIRKTIEEHLDKEKRLRDKGIKVLSLFFIDRVANYRSYDAEGNPIKGKYALIFEEAYLSIIKAPKYKVLLEGQNLEHAVTGVHNGYFAVDKKTDKKGEEIYKESKGAGSTVADESAYQLIMRDKEKLLSFDSRLKFIFSHSALREGWDNPNVFQICTLNETTSTIKKRQEIGRGLRIAVNQNGERVHGHEVNTLTVMANGSYEDFARQLQREIEEEEGIMFGVLERHIFAQIPTVTEDGETQALGVEASELLWKHFLDSGYIDAKGKVQDKLRTDLRDGKVQIPEGFEQAAPQVLELLKKITGKLNIKDADKKVRVALNKQVFLGEDFKLLWEKVKHKTTYRVDFPPKKLIKECADEIKKNLLVSRARFVTTKARVDMDRGGVEATLVQEGRGYYQEGNLALPDIVGFLQNETKLTRRTIVEILLKSERLGEFKKNPQKFIEQVGGIIKHQMRLFIVGGIKYQKIGEGSYYAQELFQDSELMGYLNENMLASGKSVYDHVVYDSGVEEEFAHKLEVNEAIKVYAKLPGWFTIDTPLGGYNPDWAVLVHVEGEDRLYFVVETKGSLSSDALRKTEEAKRDCGFKHFEALGNDVRYTVANNFDTFSQQYLSVHQ